MVTIEQIKAARALLDWTQEDLANAADISKPSVNNIERRVTTPRVETLNAIEHALEDAGVEFTEGPGVKMRGEELKVHVFEGEDSIYRMQNDVFDTLHGTDGILLVSGADEREFVKDGGERFYNVVKKRYKHGIKSKILLKDGDDYCVEPISHHRWVPDNIFNQVPYCVYGNKYAMILFGTPKRVVLTENKAIADSFRKQFMAHWESAKIPEIKKSSAPFNVED